MNTDSALEFVQLIPDEKTAETYFENIKWPEGKIKCPFCEYHGIYFYENRKPTSHRCKKCRKHFSVRTGTVMAHSKVPIQKWLFAMYLLTNMRKGASSVYLAKTLDVTQKTAWFMSRRIREAWANSDDGLKLAGEVDETDIGGNEKNKPFSKKPESIPMTFEDLVRVIAGAKNFSSVS